MREDEAREPEGQRRLADPALAGEDPAVMHAAGAIGRRAAPAPPRRWPNECRRLARQRNALQRIVRRALLLDLRRAGHRTQPASARPAISRSPTAVSDRASRPPSSSRGRVDDDAALRLARRDVQKSLPPRLVQCRAHRARSDRVPCRRSSACASVRLRPAGRGSASGRADRSPTTICVEQLEQRRGRRLRLPDRRGSNP